MTPRQFVAELRRLQPALLADESGQPRGPVAIYSLSDPRDIRTARYVGQTRAPARRHRQHVRAAQPWIVSPGEDLWWVEPARLRELYAWIRDLYQGEALLPFLLVHEWVDGVAEARRAERRRIADCLRRGLPLFNVEARRVAVRDSLTLPLPFN